MVFLAGKIPQKMEAILIKPIVVIMTTIARPIRFQLCMCLLPWHIYWLFVLNQALPTDYRVREFYAKMFYHFR